MKHLLDTNVVSELARKKPNDAVVAWFTRAPQDSHYISVITLGELRLGVEILADSPKKDELRHWLEHELTAQFEGRILSVDEGVAHRWGSLEASESRTLPPADALIAATALVHGCSLVTRNTRDFQYPGLSVINPWQ